MERKEEREMVKFLKILAVLLVILIAVELCRCSKANAAEIRGEKVLCGVSVWINSYIEKYGHSPYTEDIELLANVMWHENGMNDYYSMYYTGAVVMNRVNSPKWPNTVHDVLYQKGQYATAPVFYTQDIPPHVYLIALRILKFGTPDVPENVIYQAMFKQGKGVWKSIPSSYAPKIDIEYFCYE